jgi:hypothetical protein
MGSEICGTSRVTAFRLIHRWKPRQVAVVAYATTGHFGDTAAVGYIPIPDIADVSFMNVAARHGSVKEWRMKSAEPQHTEACWILCTASSSRIIPKQGTMDVASARWTLEPQTSVDMAVPMYGHSRLVVGRFSFEDAGLMKRARSLITSEDIPRMAREDVLPHTT